MANLNDFASRFRKGLSNPFEARGRDWCTRCQRDVDTQTEHAHRFTTYAYRRRCLRCGLVIARGVSDVVAIEAGGLSAPAAVPWSQAGGEDRSGDAWKPSELTMEMSSPMIPSRGTR